MEQALPHNEVLPHWDLVLRRADAAQAPGNFIEARLFVRQRAARSEIRDARESRRIAQTLLEAANTATLGKHVVKLDAIMGGTG